MIKLIYIKLTFQCLEAGVIHEILRAVIGLHPHLIVVTAHVAPTHALLDGKVVLESVML